MQHLAVTISRQKGCGGAYVGQRLAQALGILYVDRELVAKIAEKLKVPIEIVEAHDERMSSMLESLLECFGSSNPWLYNPPAAYTPAQQVHEVESETIRELAAERSMVIVGRGASYLLRDHPLHVSVFLYAPRRFRIERVQEIYGVSESEAIRIIDKADSERAHYNKSLSGREMTDATQYHIALDTSVLGLDHVGELIHRSIVDRFGVLDLDKCAGS